jgi:hypothetical protein
MELRHKHSELFAAFFLGCLIFLVVFVALSLSGCAARTVPVPSGTAVPVSGASFRATITNAPALLALVSVDLKPVPVCTDSLTPPCYQQSGTTLRLNLMAHDREKEQGSVNVTLLDTKGHTTGTVVRIDGWGRKK